MFITAFSGMVAGALHVLSGPDHLTAIAPLVVNARRRRWSVGLRWGLGHATGVLLLAAFAFWLRDVVPVHSLSSWCERLVGLLLIGIGLWGIRQALADRVHTHEHVHDGQRHAHIHLHGPAAEHAQPRAHAHSHTSFAIGTVHGLAGGSHLLGVLPAIGFVSRGGALVYLIAFGAGTILAMVFFSSAVGMLAEKFSFNNARSYRLLMGTCASLALLLGCYWLT
ncbi:MAG: sulfite exporter TauE/SafE family protein [Verrucomicrobia bacterium]|nr:sulfite exporter TauE/SafE family protein [Verrucomicrobiota bacterium]